ncbi:hypothetical protein XELAEV_18024549mg [Xenopus laevis]|uniref:Uncharacterized protein n=1 Tax=Xenopus laevis TaxID=8355 RepID=A0A974HL34_XENLA|nr:hypothetical protein XELAEV_18024549mg [Xenopus laevis]
MRYSSSYSQAPKRNCPPISGKCWVYRESGDNSKILMIFVGSTAESSRKSKPNKQNTGPRYFHIPLHKQGSDLPRFCILVARIYSVPKTSQNSPLLPQKLLLLDTSAYAHHCLASSGQGDNGE